MLTRHVLPGWGLLLCALAGAGGAADASMFAIVGFSDDGAYVAFERYGTHDGSAFPYSEIFFVNTRENSYAAKPVRVCLDDTEASEQDARDSVRAVAAVTMTRLGIIAGNTGTELVRAERRDTVCSFSWLDSSCTVRVHAIPAGDRTCWRDERAALMQLRMTIGSVTVDLQKDTRIPSSRGCPFEYWIAGVVGYRDRIAVIVSYFTAGYEGPDTRQIIVTGDIGAAIGGRG